MYGNILWNTPMMKKKLQNDVVICIPKINTSRSLDMQISLQLKDGS